MTQTAEIAPDRPTDSTLEADMLALGRKARAAARDLGLASPETRTRAIAGMAKALKARSAKVLEANAADLEAAKAKGMAPAMMDRLALDEKRLDGVIAALEKIAAIPDPVGVETARWTPDNGLDIARVRTPIGVLAIIYESRPNVTADAAALAVRAGNAVILRGGSECLRSNLAIHAALAEGLKDAGLSPDCVQIVTTRDRAAVGHILQGLDGSIDLLIPRGGRSLVERVQSEARVAVLGHLEGVNHVYVDASADPDMARDVVVNAKMRRVSVCGAAETLLVDKAGAERLLPGIAEALTSAGCELRADPGARKIIPDANEATDADWPTEYLAAILAVKLVDGVDGAMEHIARHSSHHTDAIVTEDAATAEKFLNGVDSAIVMLSLIHI
mgnify:CR=1 FL=1